MKTDQVSVARQPTGLLHLLFVPQGCGLGPHSSPPCGAGAVGVTQRPPHGGRTPTAATLEHAHVPFMPARVSYRGRIGPGGRSSNNGLRCARDVGRRYHSGNRRGQWRGDSGHSGRANLHLRALILTLGNFGVE